MMFKRLPINSSYRVSIGKNRAVEYGVFALNGSEVEVTLWSHKDGEYEFYSFKGEFGQDLTIYIPAEVRRKLGLEPGDEVEVSLNIPSPEGDTGLDALFG